MIYLQTLGCLWVSTFASTIFGIFWTPFPGGTPIPVTILWLGRMRIRRGELGQPTIVRSLNLLLSMVNDVTCTFTSSFFFARYLRFTMVSGWWCLTLHDFTLFGCASIMRYQWAHCSFKIGPETIQSGGQEPWPLMMFYYKRVWFPSVLLSPGCLCQRKPMVGARKANDIRIKPACQAHAVHRSCFGGMNHSEKGGEIHVESSFDSHRIHGAGIYANMTGVYWW